MAIKKISSGKWQVKMRAGKTFDGRTIWVNQQFSTKKEAEKFERNIKNEKDKGFVLPSDELFKDFMNSWFETKRNEIAIQTASNYTINISKHIVPALGKYKIGKMNLHILQQFINVNLYEEKQLKPATIKKIVTILKTAFNDAVKWELIHKNPAQYVKLPKITKEELEVWNRQQIQHFLSIAKGNRYYIVFYLAIMTGMRQGEILGLRWKDINLEEKRLFVYQTLSSDGKTFLQGGKTDYSRRSIRLSDDTIKTLKAHHRLVMSERLREGSNYRDLGLVCCTEKGTQTNPSNIRRLMKRFVDVSCVPNLTFHQLRHTHATLLLQNGVNIKAVSQRLGHADVRVTLDIYSHVTKSMEDGIAEKLDSMFA